jgi:hypothetical protein
VIKLGDLVRRKHCQWTSNNVGLVFDIMETSWLQELSVEPEGDGAMMVLIMWADGRDDAELPQMLWGTDLEAVCLPSSRAGEDKFAV